MNNKKQLAIRLAREASRFSEQGNFAQAIRKMNQSIVNEDHLLKRIELSGSYLALGEHEKALRELRFAERFANIPDIHYFRGNILKSQEKFAEAEVEYHHVITNANQLFDEKLLNEALLGPSVVRLTQNDFATGWQEHERRLQDFHSYVQLVGRLTSVTLPIPSPIFVSCEQGFGDNIMFSRFLPLLTSQAEVVLFMRSPLKSLFRNNFHVTNIYDENNTEEIRTQSSCYIQSLPFLLDRNSVSGIPQPPYLRTDSATDRKWSELMPESNGKLNIGIVWAGSEKSLQEERRSHDLLLFKRIIDDMDCNFFSLQKGDHVMEIKSNEIAEKLIDLTEQISDFSDTASLLNRLDLVISVDTAVAHLAGALGKDCWVLIPFDHDWRWGVRVNERTVWYGDNFHLFRQSTPFSWEQEFNKIYEALSARIARS